MALFYSTQAWSYCFEEAGVRYGIDPLLIKAIAMTESSLRATVESPTQDIGLMGINRSWLPILKKRFGLSASDIWHPCTNVNIGAWILASNYRQFGKNWNAVGAYNAACKKVAPQRCQQIRTQYSQKVYQNWKQLKEL